jgi:transposase
MAVRRPVVPTRRVSGHRPRAGGLNGRGTQRTASPHVLAASRTRHRLGCVLAAMREALNQRSAVAPARVRPQVPPAGHTQDGLWSDQARLPKDARRREAPASQVGPDGDQRFAWGLTADLSLGLRDLPALAALRQIGRPPDSRGTVLGCETLRWRTREAPPPAAARLASPDDRDARSCSQRDTHWGGAPGQRTETRDPGRPDQRTPLITPPATAPAGVRGPTRVPAWAARDLLPGTPVLDGGEAAADGLVPAQPPPQVAVVGPACGSESRHQQPGHGDDGQAFASDRDAQQARGPPGQTRVHWRPGPAGSGDPVSRLRCDGATGRACHARPACTPAQGAPRQLTGRPLGNLSAVTLSRRSESDPEAADALARHGSLLRAWTCGAFYAPWAREGAQILPMKRFTFVEQVRGHSMRGGWHMPPSGRPTPNKRAIRGDKPC